MARLLAGPKRDRVLFALVANRALAPAAKLAAAGWFDRRAHIDGLPETAYLPAFECPITWSISPMWTALPSSLAS